MCLMFRWRGLFTSLGHHCLLFVIHQKWEKNYTVFREGRLPILSHKGMTLCIIFSIWRKVVNCVSARIESKLIRWTRQFRVSTEKNEAFLYETTVWGNKTAYIAQQIIIPYFNKIQEFFKFEKPRLYSIQLHAVNLPVAGHTWQLRVTLDSCGSHLTVAGHVSNVYYLSPGLI